MEQHPIPRQITTFEFKLVGFMTLRQFVYLLVAIPLAAISFKIPIFFVNILLPIFFVSIGVALAFLPINDRPLDIFINNLFKRLTSPTQYTYHKHNEPLFFLTNLIYASDPHKVLAHIDVQTKLTNYLSKNTTIPSPQSNPIQMQSTVAAVNATPIQAQVQTITPAEKRPSLSGAIKNHKNLPLPGILIYVRDGSGKTVRILKTNPHGVFATYSPLVSGDYNLELKDPKGGYFFDTMKVTLNEAGSAPLEFVSKEVL
ncbi:MAG: PrgI family protein [Patescibacteria group bacterium]